MEAKINLKTIGASLLGGAIVLVVGGFILPLANSLLAFIPQNLFGNFLGITPHGVIAYGTGYLVALMVNGRIFK